MGVGRKTTSAARKHLSRRRGHDGRRTFAGGVWQPFIVATLLVVAAGYRVECPDQCVFEETSIGSRTLCPKRYPTKNTADNAARVDDTCSAWRFAEKQSVANVGLDLRSSERCSDEIWWSGELLLGTVGIVHASCSESAVIDRCSWWEAWLACGCSTFSGALSFRIYNDLMLHHGIKFFARRAQTKPSQQRQRWKNSQRAPLFQVTSIFLPARLQPQTKVVELPSANT